MFRDRDRFRVHWRAHGKRKTRSFAKEDEAQLFELKLRLGEIQKTAPKALTFSEFSDLWLEKHAKPLKSPAQVKGDTAKIKVHLRPLLGPLRLQAITTEDVLSVREALLSREHPKTKKALKPKTVNDVLATLRHLLGKAQAWGYIDQNPALSVEYVPRAEQDFDYWTPEERDRFWRFARQVDRPFAEIVMVAAFTGLRKGELAALERHQLDFQRRQIKVNATYCFATSRRLPRAKNGKMGFVPMVPEVLDLLSQYKNLEPNRTVFDRELLRHASQRLRRLAEKVGSRPIRFHDLRHSFGSALAMAGLEAYTRQRLMRHETAQMTQRYSHLAPDHLAEAISALSRAPSVTQCHAEVANTPESWSRRPDLKPLVS